MTDLAPYTAAFGPVLGVALWLWFNKSQKPSEKPDDPTRAVVVKLDGIADKLTEIHTDIAIIMDRGKR